MPSIPALSTTSIPSVGEVSNLAQTGALSVWNYASDAIIIILLLLALLLFAYRVGRGPFVGTLLSFYSAYAVYVTFPFMSYIPTAPALTAVLAHVGLYIALVIIFYVIMRRVVVSDFLFIGTVSLLLLSFLGAGFLIAFAYQVFDIETLYKFSPTMDLLFANKQFFFWWFAGPAIGLFFLAR